MISKALKNRNVSQHNIIGALWVARHCISCRGSAVRIQQMKRSPMLELINILEGVLLLLFSFLPFASKILRESLLFYHAKQEEQAKMYF